ncbi:MAG: hypothetical protein ACR2L3_03235, partial [Actinomycetota bacterium]
MGRSTVRILIVLALVALPAGIYRARCGAGGCEKPPPPAEVPYCSLGAATRTALANGTREGRSPDIFMVTRRGGSGLWPPAGDDRLWPWPTADGPTSIPLILWGHGIKDGAAVPPSAGADDVAPTLAAV